MKAFYRGMLLLLVLLLISCSQAAQENVQTEIQVSAASSLSAPLNKVKELYEAHYPDRKVVINYGSSGTLVNQLDQGAPVDAVILASTSWMDKAIGQNTVKRENVKELFTNQLILAAHQDSILVRKEELVEDRVEKIAIGDPDSVPAGNYARQALLQLEYWEELQEKIVLAKSARQVAAYIESNNVDAGLIFKSDLIAFSKLRAVELISSTLHDPIIYPAALVDRNGKMEQTEEFLAFLTGAEAIPIFQEYGFEEIR